MNTGGLFILFLIVAMIYAIYLYAKSNEKTADATFTAIYIVAYPALFIFSLDNKPIDNGWKWIGVPLVMAGLPWLFSGFHLYRVVENPSATNNDEFVGFPIKLWIIGGILSCAMGLYFF